jgi:multidrug efflux pump subunit AcrA (membrane-fusion protein)
MKEGSMNLWKNRNLMIAILIFAVIGAFVVMKPAAKSELRIGKVKKETLIQRVTIAGTAEPIRTTVVTAPYDGYIKRLFVKLGQKIQVGEPVVSIAQSLQASENVFPIRAPFSGIVTQVVKNEGQFAKQNDPKEFVLRIDDLSKMFINANAPEIDVVKIQSGFEADIKVSAILSHNYKGVVREISQAATAKEQWGVRSQVEYLIKIEITDADAQLKPGMSAVVDIITNKKENVLTLEHEFIQKDNDKYFVILKNGKRRDIKVGLQNESVFEIAEGLREGEEVQQLDFLKLIESQK